MGKHHKRKKHRREEYMPPYQPQQFQQPVQQQGTTMHQNQNMQQNPQMMNNPMQPNPNAMQQNPIMGMFGGMGANPLMRLLGSVDIGMISQLLLGLKPRSAGQENTKNTNTGNPINDILNNFNENDINNIMNNVDQDQISSILRQLNLNDQTAGTGEGKDNFFNLGDYYREDGSEFEAGDKSYSASEVMGIIAKLLDNRNSEFLDKVIELYDDYK